MPDPSSTEPSFSGPSSDKQVEKQLKDWRLSAWGSGAVRSGAEAMFIMSVIQLFDFPHKQIKIKTKLPVQVMPVSSLS